MTESGCRIVALISGNGSNLQALLDARDAGHLPATMCAVISNRASAFGLERARRAGIDAEVVDHRALGGRTAFERVLAERIDTHAPDFILLAGFMRVLTSGFVTRYTGRLINIHPSLLPAYRGLHTHERALADGARTHGCSVHFVIPELDAGPVILQGEVAVAPDDDAATLARRVQAMEHRVYPIAANWLARGQVTLDGDRVLWAGVPRRRPPRLSGDTASGAWMDTPPRALGA